MSQTRWGGRNCERGGWRLQGEGMRSAEMLVWMGDFNYRIELDYDTVVQLVRNHLRGDRGALAALLEEVSPPPQVTSHRAGGDSCFALARKWPACVKRGQTCAGRRPWIKVLLLDRAFGGESATGFRVMM